MPDRQEDKPCRVLLKEALEKGGYSLHWYYNGPVDRNGFDYWRASFTTNYRPGVTYEGQHWARTKAEAADSTARFYWGSL